MIIIKKKQESKKLIIIISLDLLQKPTIYIDKLVGPIYQVYSVSIRYKDFITLLTLITTFSLSNSRNPYKCSINMKFTNASNLFHFSYKKKHYFYFGAYRNRIRKRVVNLFFFLFLRSLVVIRYFFHLLR